MKKDFELEFYKSEVKRLELELEFEKANKQLPDEMKNDIQEIVDLASEMRNLLSECRYEQINMNLAKRIDYVLQKAAYMD
ncbi:MAG: hypothetical protein RLZZ546_2449 [Bacteroidota bacterium]|jgi:hypothetical protein